MSTQQEPKLAENLIEWVTETVASPAPPIEVRGLRFGDSPWLLSYQSGDVILRVVDDAAAVDLERSALEATADSGVPVPRVLGFRHDPDVSLLLTTRLDGNSTIPRRTPEERLRTLGRVAARLSRVPAPAGLPHRSAPIGGVDFAELRAIDPPALMVAAERAIAGYEPVGPDVFVHGDLWEGNVMWVGDEVTGVIDWDCAGTGKAGVDLGSLRGDAVQNFGLGAERFVLEGWEAEAGTAALDVAYWDIVTELATPPDMGWFVEVAQSQGRPDLTREVMLDRRDGFLRQAMEQFERDRP